MEQDTTLNELAAAVVASDPELRNELRTMVKELIGIMRYQIRHGDDSTKVALAKSMVPQLLKSMQNVDRDEQEQDKRAAYERILAGVRGDLKVAND